MDEATVNTIVDPTAIKILHKARLFDQTKQVATKKKVAAKKKVLRSTKAPQGEREAKARRMKKAQDRLREVVIWKILQTYCLHVGKHR